MDVQLDLFDNYSYRRKVRMYAFSPLSPLDKMYNSRKYGLLRVVSWEVACRYRRRFGGFISFERRWTFGILALRDKDYNEVPVAYVKLDWGKVDER